MSRVTVRERWLRRGLVLSGTCCCVAFVAVFLPVSTMAAIHARLGLGEFPEAPLVDYLTRSASLLYGALGVVSLAVARDVERHAGLVRTLAALHVLIGFGKLAIDLHAGMPLVWTCLEGPPVALLGAVLWGLAPSERTQPAERPRSETGIAGVGISDRARPARPRPSRRTAPR